MIRGLVTPVPLRARMCPLRSEIQRILYAQRDVEHCLHLVSTHDDEQPNRPPACRRYRVPLGMAAVIPIWMTLHRVIRRAEGRGPATNEFPKKRWEPASNYANLTGMYHTSRAIGRA